MSDIVPKLDPRRLLFQIGTDIKWRKMKTSDFLTQSDITIPMTVENEGMAEVWLNDSDMLNEEATKSAFEQFDVKKVVEDALLTCHETRNKKTWKDTGLKALLKMANSHPPSSY